ncbi:MAG: hypothetical protein IPK61_17150 [Saprospiraceae bacterium]|nr:hypothetical protein [Saprospiraceae bacterium]
MQILVLIKINFPILQMGHRLMSIPVLINMRKGIGISTFGIGGGSFNRLCNFAIRSFYLDGTNIPHDVYNQEQGYHERKFTFG